MMSFLAEVLIEVLANILSWRAWLCFLGGLAGAFFLAAYDIFLVWPRDIPVLFAILALGIGIYWETQSG
jgi:hypothetical protein